MEPKPKRSRQSPWYRDMLIVVALLLQSCVWLEVEDLGSGFFFLVWVTEGMGHTGRDRDLYYRSVLGIPRRIHKDVTGAEVSPTGERVLFFTWGDKPGDEVLYLFDRNTSETLKMDPSPCPWKISGVYRHNGSWSGQIGPQISHCGRA